MKYFHYFADSTARDKFLNEGGFIVNPYVDLITDTDSIGYNLQIEFRENVIDEPLYKVPLTLHFLEDGTFGWKKGNNYAKIVGVKINDSDWDKISAGNTITVKSGDIVTLKQLEANSKLTSSNAATGITTTAKFNVWGNINSVCNPSSKDNWTYTWHPSVEVFRGFFYQSKPVDASKLILSVSNTAGNGVYQDMFLNCSTLINGPYIRMNITYSSPVYCSSYRNSMDDMFSGCSNLEKIYLMSPTISTPPCSGGGLFGSAGSPSNLTAYKDSKSIVGSEGVPLYNDFSGNIVDITMR